MLDHLNKFPLCQLHFSFLALDELRLEGFTGSTWHGALGHALARVAPEAFEQLYGLPGQDAGTPRPFVLLPDLAAGAASPPLGFTLTLLGEATALAQVLVLAVENLAATGLGNRQIPLRLLRVLQTHDVTGRTSALELLGPDGIWRGEWLAPVGLSRLASAWQPAASSAVLLRFDTRLRLKAGSSVLKQPPGCEVLLQRLLERVSSLSQLYGPGALASETPDAHGRPRDERPWSQRLLTRSNRPCPSAASCMVPLAWSGGWPSPSNRRGRGCGCCIRARRWCRAW
jgi:hypothetical protein